MSFTQLPMPYHLLLPHHLCKSTLALFSQDDRHQLLHSCDQEREAEREKRMRSSLFSLFQQGRDWGQVRRAKTLSPMSSLMKMGVVNSCPIFVFFFLLWMILLWFIFWNSYGLVWVLICDVFLNVVVFFCTLFFLFKCILIWINCIRMICLSTVFSFQLYLVF